ncbi:MAG TPA: hypothetical protein VLX90_17990, partial [Steroidobacteraceae bacterium]|nr:hypothetical protein [Steroidobacteraceae bacterium]
THVKPVKRSGLPATLATQAGRAAQSSHLPFGLAGPLKISHLPHAVAASPGVKKRQPLQVLPGSGDLSV